MLLSNYDSAAALMLLPELNSWGGNLVASGATRTYFVRVDTKAATQH